MIKYNDVYDIKHYEYGIPYSGEYERMRYRIARDPLKKVSGKAESADARLEVVIWKGPFAFNKTNEEKITRFFPFSEDGKKEAVDWINEEFIKSPSIWKR